MRIVTAMLAAAAVVVVLAIPAGAGARTLWICDVPEDDGTVTTVTFVSAADAAIHGIMQANSRAGVVFRNQFGESCHVE
jgi:hypothetical protein